MAITTSAKKAHRVAARKRVFNIRRSRAMNESVKEIRLLIAGKKTAEALKLVPATFQAIDKAAKTKLIKKNAASRYKSRISAAIAKASK